MKTKLITLTMLAASMLFLANCSSKKEHNHDEHAAESHASGSSTPADTTPPQFTVDAAFQQQLAGVFTAYVSLKDAFVASDAAKVKTAAAATMQELSKVDMKLLEGAAHNDWMTYTGSLKNSLTLILSSDDLEVQRENFSALSDNLYKSVQAYGLGGVTAYYDYCPMAFDNQGAHWLSSEEKILNPYFGSKMLTCGQVKDKVN